MIYKQFGKTILVTHETTVYTLTGEKEQRQAIIELVEKHDNSKSEKAKKVLENKIIKLMKVKEQLENAKVEKEVSRLKAEKKLAKKEISKEKPKKVNSKEIALAESLENDLKEQTLQDIKDENEKLKAENEKLKNSLEKAKEVKPAVSSTGLSRRGEY